MVRQGGLCGKIVHISVAEPSVLRIADIAGSRPAETIPNSSGFGPHLSCVSSPGTWFTKCLGTSFTVLLWNFSRTPVLDDRRALECEIEFPDEGVAVINLDSRFQANELHPVAGQGLADVPVAAIDVQFARTVHLADPGSSRILPAWRMRIVAPLTGPPATRRSLHRQRFMRSNVVVFETILIQPPLRVRPRSAATLQRPLQSPVETFHLALRLRVPDAAPVQANPLLHQPQ